MQSLTFFILMALASYCRAEVDSTLWPLPESVTLTFDISGSFHYYNITPWHSGDYDTIQDGHITFLPLNINRYSWTLGDSNSLLYSTELIQGTHKKTTFAKIKLDTTNKQILSLTYSTYSEVRESFAYTELAYISIKGIDYSREKLIVIDSDFSKNLISVSYSETDGGKVNQDKGTILIASSKITVSGSLNYHLLDVLPSLKRFEDKLGIIYHPDEVFVSVPQKYHSSMVKLFSITGNLVQIFPTIGNEAHIPFANLNHGLYFISTDHLSGKVIIP